MTSPSAPLTPYGGEAGPLENTHVLRHRGQGHREAACDLADGAITSRKLREDGAPSRIREGAECGVERVLLINHMV